MLSVFEFNALEQSYLREELNTILNYSRSELLHTVNNELLQRFSKTLLVMLSEKLGKEVYTLRLKNVGTLEFIVNEEEDIYLNEYIKYATSATHVAKTYPHVFSLAIDYPHMKKWEKFYKKVLRNNNFKAILDYFEGKKISKLYYTDAVYLFTFLKLNESLKNFFNNLNKPLTIFLESGLDPKKEFDNILYLIGETSIDDLINTIVFQGKYLKEPPNKGEYIIYNYKGNEIIIPLKSINDITEIKYKIKFEIKTYY